MTYEEAMALLRRYNKEPFHLCHAITVSKVMRRMADALGYGEEADFWAVVGLLHDIDFEQWPDEHCKKCVELLREGGADERLIHAVVSHGYGLCADVGTISGHALTGYVAGDILPASVWDCEHRPISSPEGMVYSEECDKWFDIYLTSYTGTIADGDLAVQSVYGATTADGASGVTFHWYTFAKYYKQAKKMMMNQEEFMSISTGSNQGTNIAGSADVGKTGGYKDTAGRRMISNIGCEDCCGNLWQWGIETGDTNTGNSWSNAYGGSDDASQLGQGYQVPSRAIFGGNCGSGAICGSRGSEWDYVPLSLSASLGSRACAEPLHRSA